MLLPDRDADGLCAGVIMHRTLTHMGAQDIQVRYHLVFLRLRQLGIWDCHLLLLGD